MGKEVNINRRWKSRKKFKATARKSFKKDKK
jgi:hypothetical protein